MTKVEWVVGFLFNDDATEVVLIRKNRPEWQAGRLNGVGGKVEQDDVSLVGAMEREFLEEVGVEVYGDGWHHFASLDWEEGVVHFLRAFDDEAYRMVRRRVGLDIHKTDEKVECHYLRGLFVPEVIGPITPNLLWLVPLAAHRHDTYDVIDVVETGTTMRKPGRLGVHPGSPKMPSGEVELSRWRPGPIEVEGGEGG